MFSIYSSQQSNRRGTAKLCLQPASNFPSSLGPLFHCWGSALRIRFLLCLKHFEGQFQQEAVNTGLIHTRPVVKARCNSNPLEDLSLSSTDVWNAASLNFFPSVYLMSERHATCMLFQRHIRCLNKCLEQSRSLSAKSRWQKYSLLWDCWALKPVASCLLNAFKVQQRQQRQQVFG